MIFLNAPVSGFTHKALSQKKISDRRLATLAMEAVSAVDSKAAVVGKSDGKHVLPPAQAYEDIETECKSHTIIFDGHVPSFVWSGEEQEHYHANKWHNKPNFCPACRKGRRKNNQKPFRRLIRIPHWYRGVALAKYRA